jgi:hypothetical protein
MHSYALIAHAHAIDALAARRTTSLGRRRRRHRLVWPGRRIQPELNRVLSA